jgi:GNAT superfamily N-acetyltransferase
MNLSRGDYRLTDDRSALDPAVVFQLLRSTYWAADRTAEQVAKSMEHSICFGLFHGETQVGFARAVSDRVTFCYLCDVIVALEHRGLGLGKWIVACMLDHPDLQTTTQCLRTRDAHALYEPFGFERTEYLRRSSHDWSTPPGKNS